MNNLEKFKEIDTFIFDVDGVLTDNTVLVLESGRLLRTMNIRDGLAVKLAIDKGYNVAIITGGRSQGVIKRLQLLGVEDIYYGVSDKVAAYEEYLKSKGLTSHTVLYMGDDLPDISVLRLAGLSACPKDATHQVVNVAQYVSPIAGGKGCARDVIEKTMTLRGDWITITAR